MESRNRKAVKAIIGCCLATFWSGTLAFAYPGVMSTEWQQMYNVGPAEIGSVVTLMLISLAVMMFFSGKAHRRFGMKICVLIGLGFNIGAFLMLMAFDSIWGVYIWSFVANLGCSFIYGPGLTTVQQWLPHRRGTASGIFNVIFGLSAAVMSPLLNRLLDIIGYSRLNILLVVSIIITYIIAFILAEVPEKAHLTEEEQKAHDSLLSKVKQGNLKAGKTVSQSLKMKEYWIFWFILAFMGGAGISMISLSKSYAVMLGIASVTILTSFNLANGLIRLISGFLTDKFGGDTIGICCFATAGIGYFILIFATSPVLMAVAAGCVGVGFGGLFTVSGPVVSGIFGLEHFGAIYGLLYTGYGLVGGIAGPALAGIILAVTNNNYQIVFAYLGVFAILAALLMFTLKKLVNKKTAA